MQIDKTQKARVLIVDDHPIVRSGLKQIEDLDQGLRVVGEAATGADALAQAQRLKPTVVLLDYRLPDTAGDEVCRRMKAGMAGVRVLFLSSYADETSVSAALDAGADGYLLKQNDAQKIVDAIHVVCQGGLVIDPSIARVAVGRKESGGTPPALEKLSDQERKVLAELAKGKTDKEIADGLNLQAKTIRNYLAGVYRKLNVHTRTQAALLYERATQKRD